MLFLLSCTWILCRCLGLLQSVSILRFNTVLHSSNILLGGYLSVDTVLKLTTYLHLLNKKKNLQRWPAGVSQLLKQNVTSKPALMPQWDVIVLKAFNVTGEVRTVLQRQAAPSTEHTGVIENHDVTNKKFVSVSFWLKQTSSYTGPDVLFRNICSSHTHTHATKHWAIIIHSVCNNEPSCVATDPCVYFSKAAVAACWIVQTARRTGWLELLQSCLPCTLFWATLNERSHRLLVIDALLF